MSMEYRVRNVETDDGPAVVEIFDYFVESSFAAYPEGKVGPDFFDKLRMLSSGYPFVVVETNEREVVGFAMLRPFYMIDSFKRSAELTYFLLPEHTGKKLGSRILRSFIEQARKMGIDTLLASISSLNEQSIRFHEKHGFAECGRFRRVGRKHGRDFDVVWMQLFI